MSRKQKKISPLTIVYIIIIILLCLNGQKKRAERELLIEDGKPGVALSPKYVE